MLKPIDMQVIVKNVDQVAKVRKVEEQNLTGQQINAQNNMGKEILKEKNTHGVMLAIQMEQLCKKLEKSYDHGFISVIIAAVALHMGIFTDASLGHKFNNEYGDNNNVKIVHLADMVASRKTEDLYDGLAKWEYPKELV